MCCVFEVPCLPSVPALSFPGIAHCPGIHWMDVSTSFWLCSLLVVVNMFVTIGCLWCCICAMACIVDCESVIMTTRCKYFDPCYARATVVRARFLAAAFSDGSYLAHVNGAYLRHVTFCIVRGPPPLCSSCRLSVNLGRGPLLT